MGLYANRARVAYLRRRSIRQMAGVTLVILMVMAVLGIAGTEDLRDQEQGAALTAEIRSYAVARSKEAAAVVIVDGELQHVSTEGRPE